jgi:hypothetical protein
MEKMDIFLSWHGQRGNAVASALQDWLPQIVNAFNPWFSSGTDKGSRWRSEVATRLAKARAGIIILTPSALTSSWLLFEAGAIAKSPQKTYACTLLIDLKNEDVTDPLAQFQHTPATKDEILKLMTTLNAALGDEHMPDAHVKTAFEKWWPELEKKLENLPPDEPTKIPHRDQRELLTELIGLTRQTSLSVLESHHRIMEEISRLEGMQAYANTMIPAAALSPSWLEAASEALGGGNESNKSTIAPPRGSLAKAFSRNAIRDRLMSVTPQDQPEKK